MKTAVGSFRIWVSSSETSMIKSFSFQRRVTFKFLYQTMVGRLIEEKSDLVDHPDQLAFMFTVLEWIQNEDAFANPRRE